MRSLVIWLALLGCTGCGEGDVPPQAAAPAGSQAAADLPAATGSADVPENQPVAPVTAVPPPEATIKAVLEKEMWGPPEQGGTQHTYTYRTLKIAPAREGNYLTDGVPPNTRTVVHPVKVVVDITKLYTDGSTAQDAKDQTYVFFVDEFGEWTYRFLQNN